MAAWTVHAFRLTAYSPRAVYVGVSYLSPAERLAQHRMGYKSSRQVRRSRRAGGGPDRRRLRRQVRPQSTRANLPSDGTLNADSPVRSWRGRLTMGRVRFWSGLDRSLESSRAPYRGIGWGPTPPTGQKAADLRRLIASREARQERFGYTSPEEDARVLQALRRRWWTLGAKQAAEREAQISARARKRRNAKKKPPPKRS
jgi:hypothetical protein